MVWFWNESDNVASPEKIDIKAYYNKKIIFLAKHIIDNQSHEISCLIESKVWYDSYFHYNDLRCIKMTDLSLSRYYLVFVSEKYHASLNVTYTSIVCETYLSLKQNYWRLWWSRHWVTPVKEKSRFLFESLYWIIRWLIMMNFEKHEINWLFRWSSRFFSFWGCQKILRNWKSLIDYCSILSSV